MHTESSYQAPKLTHYGSIRNLTRGQAIIDDFDFNFNAGEEIPTNDDGDPLIGSMG